LCGRCPPLCPFGQKNTLFARIHPLSHCKFSSLHSYRTHPTLAPPCNHLDRTLLCESPPKIEHQCSRDGCTDYATQTHTHPHAHAQPDRQTDTNRHVYTASDTDAHRHRHAQTQTQRHPLYTPISFSGSTSSMPPTHPPTTRRDFTTVRAIRVTPCDLRSLRGRHAGVSCSAYSPAHPSYGNRDFVLIIFGGGHDQGLVTPQIACTVLLFKVG